jgi:hypothetical protein
VVWAFKAKGKELVDKKNVRLDPSRKSQERTTEQRAERIILQEVNKRSPGEKMTLQAIEIECGDGTVAAAVGLWA